MVVGKGTVSDALVEELVLLNGKTVIEEIINSMPPVIAHKRLKKSLYKFREHKIVRR